MENDQTPKNETESYACEAQGIKCAFEASCFERHVKEYNKQRTRAFRLKKKLEKAVKKQ